MHFGLPYESSGIFPLHRLGPTLVKNYENTKHFALKWYNHLNTKQQQNMFKICTVSYLHSTTKIMLFIKLKTKREMGTVSFYKNLFLNTIRPMNFLNQRILRSKSVQRSYVLYTKKLRFKPFKQLAQSYRVLSVEYFQLHITDNFRYSSSNKEGFTFSYNGKAEVANCWC